MRMQSIVAQHLEIDNVHDPLLATNFARWTTPTFQWNMYLFLNKFKTISIFICDFYPEIIF